MIMCRSKQTVDDTIKEKVSMFCHVDCEHVMAVPDVSSVYRVPVLLHQQRLTHLLVKQLKLSLPKRSINFLLKWKELADRFDQHGDSVRIALVGKYVKLEDAYISVIKALTHSALACRRKLEVQWVEAEHLEKECEIADPVKYHDAWKGLCSCSGVLVPGGFGVRGTEGKVRAAEWARKNKKPYLGVCLGLQIAAIEFARNVLGWEDANSSEMNPDTKHPVVIDMPEHNPGQMGGTMRLGKRRTIFKDKKSKLKKLYLNSDHVDERHRHRYEINPVLVPEFEKMGMQFVGHDEAGERMEIMELEGHPYYVAVQFHPEFLSRPVNPSPPYLGLILSSIGKLDTYISRGCRLSPRSSFTEDSDDEEIINTSIDDPSPASARCST